MQVQLELWRITVQDYRITVISVLHDPAPGLIGNYT